MMGNIAVFAFHEVHEVRVQVIDGEPWFCLKDVCDVLTVDRTSRLIRELDDKGLANCHTPTKGGKQQLVYVNEPNLYRVIFRSNKPDARQFQDWVFNEVLPAIRKTGNYQFIPPAPQQSGEPLTRQDQNELEWIINDISRSFHFNRRWVIGIWHALRWATGNPSPNPFLTTEVPIIVHELRRILHTVERGSRYMREVELDLLKTVRDGCPVTECIERKGAISSSPDEFLPARLEMALTRLLSLESKVSTQMTLQ
ncbi:Bro-N domain-containing protein [Pectobacterium brasiliense]|uniref:BRO-N domain-containing protein n=1 Tax=Pectobacterium brasiliense TaxID=180957 RepID=UPI00191BA271|nr:BRO family protein [Pectobacterium carotovorum]